ncbi:MAG: 2-C-methyl-D-erythritol 2,4-cyclodiphosphate synthase [candidate division KSB1 bacterium]|nr:2-C-methyl-D-erythritol 2,4-cyclodiphosphate synthase [candidate division KSB1 bacterium]MDZ7303094.1 2-C-methyl-D-erythritol 2,4-cyclodiphosphate synthase [candidate division KSB1 bacterium]MDZ7312633.1 2-C-methyl-D-erythritol 2,4-cyclodiphosphate synthase [candidate division KSB1 bacterium]
MRIGFGYDVHPLVGGRRLVLGGVEIKHDFGLAGHSDADVLSHAIGDALLGAANLGDLGQHFPDTNAQFANLNSLLLLKQIAGLLREHHYHIVNIDATLVLEAPKVMPHAEQMRQNLAAALEISPSQISVKATTSEKLGFVGRKEGATAFAIALLNDVGE